MSTLLKAEKRESQLS